MAAAELGQPEPAEIVADLGQRRVGVADRAQAVDFAPLPAQGLGDHHRIAAPAGQDADAAKLQRALVLIGCDFRAVSYRRLSLQLRHGPSSVGGIVVGRFRGAERKLAGRRRLAQAARRRPAATASTAAAFRAAC